MANRTFKVYGQAYAASGDVLVVMTVNGTEVFSGAVNDSSTPFDGEPTMENHLWTYELDVNTTGELAVSIAVTGGTLALGRTEYNQNIIKFIPNKWFVDNNPFTAENQIYMAETIGQALLDAEQEGLYDKLMAGTATEVDDGSDIYEANLHGPRFATEYKFNNNIRTNLAIDGDINASAIAEANTDIKKAFWWPQLLDGETLTYDWEFDPDTDAFVI